MDTQWISDATADVRTRAAYAGLLISSNCIDGISSAQQLTSLFYFWQELLIFINFCHIGKKTYLCYCSANNEVKFDCSALQTAEEQRSIIFQCLV
jgi:hypothetical protein